MKRRKRHAFGNYSRPLFMTLPEFIREAIGHFYFRPEMENADRKS